MAVKGNVKKPVSKAKKARTAKTAKPEAEAVAPEAEAVAPEAEAVAPEAEAVAPEAEAVAPEAEAVAPETTGIPVEDMACGIINSFKGLGETLGNMCCKRDAKPKKILVEDFSEVFIKALGVDVAIDTAANGASNVVNWLKKGVGIGTTPPPSDNQQ